MKNIPRKILEDLRKTPIGFLNKFVSQAIHRHMINKSVSQAIGRRMMNKNHKFLREFQKKIL